MPEFEIEIPADFQDKMDEAMITRLCEISKDHVTTYLKLGKVVATMAAEIDAGRKYGWSMRDVTPELSNRLLRVFVDKIYEIAEVEK